MLDEIVNETPLPDAPSAEEFLFGHAADNAAAEAGEEEDSQAEAEEEAEQDPQGSDGAVGAVRLAWGTEGGRVHQGKPGHHRRATHLVGPAHRIL